MKTLYESILTNTKSKVKKATRELKSLGMKIACCNGYANVLGDEYFDVERLREVTKGMNAHSEVITNLINYPTKNADPIRLEGLDLFLVWLDNVEIPSGIDGWEVDDILTKKMKKDKICRLPVQWRTVTICGGVELRYRYDLIDTKIRCVLLRFEINKSSL